MTALATQTSTRSTDSGSRPTPGVAVCRCEWERQHGVQRRSDCSETEGRESRDEVSCACRQQMRNLHLSNNSTSGRCLTHARESLWSYTKVQRDWHFILSQGAKNRWAILTQGATEWAVLLTRKSLGCSEAGIAADIASNISAAPREPSRAHGWSDG